MPTWLKIALAALALGVLSSKPSGGSSAPRGLIAQNMGMGTGGAAPPQKPSGLGSRAASGGTVRTTQDPSLFGSLLDIGASSVGASTNLAERWATERILVDGAVLPALYPDSVWGPLDLSVPGAVTSWPFAARQAVADDQATVTDALNPNSVLPAFRDWLSQRGVELIFAGKNVPQTRANLAQASIEVAQELQLTVNPVTWMIVTGAVRLAPAMIHEGDVTKTPQGLIWLPPLAADGTTAGYPMIRNSQTNRLDKVPLNGWGMGYKASAPGWIIGTQGKLPPMTDPARSVWRALFGTPLS